MRIFLSDGHDEWRATSDGMLRRATPQQHINIYVEDAVAPRETTAGRGVVEGRTRKRRQRTAVEIDEFAKTITAAEDERVTNLVGSAKELLPAGW